MWISNITIYYISLCFTVSFCPLFFSHKLLAVGLGRKSIRNPLNIYGKCLNQEQIEQLWEHQLCLKMWWQPAAAMDFLVTANHTWIPLAAQERWCQRKSGVTRNLKNSSYLQRNNWVSLKNGVYLDMQCLSGRLTSNHQIWGYPMIRQIQLSQKSQDKNVLTEVPKTGIH